jgi:hypothetical protein
MTPDECLRLTALQQRVFRCIEDCLREDGHHKSYEGSMEVTMTLPNVFEQGGRIKWSVSLHCYLICDGRHDTWTGNTLSEALAKAEEKIDSYCQPYEMKRFERDMGLCDDEEGEADGSRTIYAAKYDPTKKDEDEEPTF